MKVGRDKEGWGSSTGMQMGKETLGFPEEHFGICQAEKKNWGRKIRNERGWII